LRNYEKIIIGFFSGKLRRDPTLCPKYYASGFAMIFVEKSKVKFNSLTSALSDKDCQTSYFYIGTKAGEGSSLNSGTI